jgi:hypothetical protein
MHPGFFSDPESHLLEQPEGLSMAVKPRKPSGTSHQALDNVVAQAHSARAERERGYREQSLKLHPWVCGRCGREFTRENLHELTVHHKDHNHDNNPPDGSNWENLCLYCHDNEHSRYLDQRSGSLVSDGQRPATSGHKAFANLKDLLKKNQG